MKTTNDSRQTPQFLTVEMETALQKKDDMSPERDQDLGSEDLNAILDAILDVEKDSLVSEDEVLVALLGMDPAQDERAEGGDSALAMEPNPIDDEIEDLSELMDDGYDDSRRVARLGECLLLVSSDSMSATLRGNLPKGTQYSEILALVKEAGICFGVNNHAIHSMLPKRTRGRTAHKTADQRREAVVAEGQLPVSPDRPRIRYSVPTPAQETIDAVRKTLDGSRLEAVKHCKATLPLVAAGQVLARIEAEGGEAGYDIFGHTIEATPSATIELPSCGQYVRLSADGTTCHAEICGYAIPTEETIYILPPIWISRDLLRAYFVYLDQEAPAPTLDAKQIHAALKSLSVAHGIDKSAIKKLARHLERDSSIERVSLLAHGKEAVPGTDASWCFSFEPGLTKFFIEIVRVMIKSPRVGYLDQYCLGLAGKSVATGECIAYKKPPTEGEAGIDVFGEEFMPDEPGDDYLELGDGLSLSADGKECFADVFGYVGIHRKRIEITSPIWVDPERMNAYFVNLPNLGERAVPTPTDIEALFVAADVCTGTDQAAIALLCEKSKQNMPMDLVIPLAHGNEPVHGRDGRFSFSVDIEAKPGLLREDGSIDFRQLNQSHLVKANTCIGSSIPATEGKAGSDLSGKVLAGHNGFDVTMELGKNVRHRSKEGAPDRYYAEIEGDLIFTDYRDRRPPRMRLAVHETMVISGDVDFHIGNIEFPGNVEIRGSVCPGFRVRAEGNITVAKSVEMGAQLSCDGDLVVAEGIIGDQTHCRTAGSVYSTYVQAAHIEAGQDITLSEYAYDADLRAGNEVEILGSSKSGRGGALVGGRVMAGRRISAHHIGFDSGEPIQLIAGFDLEPLQRSKCLKDMIERCDSAIKKALGALQVEQITPQKMSGVLLNMVLRARGPQRKTIARTVKNILALEERRTLAKEEIKELDAQLMQVAKTARIEIHRHIDAGVHLKIGSYTHVVQNEEAAISKIKFSLRGVDKKTQLRMTTLEAE
jgi:uncharacterized protein (DUF342 family)